MAVGIQLLKGARAFALGALTAASLAGTAAAATLDFAFTFTNLANGGGTVTGIVFGLEDNATSAATSLQVTANTEGLGLGEFIGTPDVNVWTVVNGEVTGSAFQSFGVHNSSPAVTDSSLYLVWGLFGDLVGLDDDPFSVGVSGGSGLLYSRLEPSSVPLPASAWLLLPALAALSGLTRHGGRKTAG